MFLVYSGIALIGIAAFSKVLFISIQPDQWLDKVLNWQNRLHKWSVGTTFWDEYRYKSWGGCALCFSRFTAFFSFWAYLFMSLYLGQIWLPHTLVWVDILANVFWWIAFCSISTIFNFIVITKI